MSYKTTSSTVSKQNQCKNTRLLGYYFIYSRAYSIGCGSVRPANSHDSAVSLTIFCNFSRSPDKAPNLTVFGKNLSETVKGNKLTC